MTMHTLLELFNGHWMVGYYILVRDGDSSASIAVHSWVNIKEFDDYKTASREVHFLNSGRWGSD